MSQLLFPPPSGNPLGSVPGGLSGNLAAANAVLPANGNGAGALNPSTLTLVVWGTFVGTVALQVSKAGAAPNWVTVGTPLTAPGVLSIPAMAGDLVFQVIMTAFTSGTASVYAAGTSG